MDNRLATDLNYILEHTVTVWDELRNQHIFITGGTGFIGCWLLEAIAWANQVLETKISVTILTRNQEAFFKKAPHLAMHDFFKFEMGNVRNFTFSKNQYSHIIHAATDASKHLNETDPLCMLNTILDGTRRTLDFATSCHAQKFLFVSSGAVYGKQPSDVTHIDENYKGAPDPTQPQSAYSIGKFTAEHMCLLHAKQHSIAIKIARCFAFVGPYLPLDVHFAIGNFIHDGLNQKEIFVNGDGSPYRSYQYAADLVIWLLHILCHGQISTPYNVGAEESISILDLAKKVAKSFSPEPPIKVAKIADSTQLPERYVPSIKRAQNELSLKNRITLQDGIQKTITWHKEKTI